EVVEEQGQGGVGGVLHGPPLFIERLVHLGEQDGVAQRDHFRLDGDGGQVLDGPGAADDAGAVADRARGLVAEGVAGDHIVDGVLQYAGDAVVVLRRDEQVGVGGGHGLVPAANLGGGVAGADGC